MRQRRQWIIDRHLQGRFIFILLLVGLLNLLFYIFSLQYFIGELIRLHGGQLNIPLPIIYKTAFFAFAVQAVLLTLLAVYFSNRISGPVYRFNSVLKAFGRGDAGEIERLPAIKLRKDDFMQELGNNINQTLIYYHRFRVALLTELENLVVQKRLTTADAQRLRELLEKTKVPDQASEAT